MQHGSGAEAWQDPKVHAHRWWILATLCLSLVLIVAGVSSLNVALPTISRDLEAPFSDLQWMVDAYALVFAGLLLPAGALGDRFGRKGALQLGLVIVAGAAIVSTAADSASFLIFTRAAMGVGAAFVMPATLSILANSFPPHERPKAIAVWAGFAGAGAALGPLMSGFLLEHFYWGSVFWINVPIVAVALGAGYVLLPTSRDPEQRPLDPVGAVLSVAGLGALLYAVIEAPDAGWAHGSTIGFGVAAVVLLAGFVRWEMRRRDPMLELSWFRIRAFSVGSVTILLTFFAMFGLFFIITQYLQFVQGYSALKAGAATLPMAFTMVLVSPRSAMLVAKFGRRVVSSIGLLFTAGGFVVLSTLGADSGYLQLAAALVFLGIGIGTAVAPATSAIMTSLPMAKAGVGSAVNDTTREVGGSIGIAVLGSVLNTLYRDNVGDAEGLPAEASEAVRDSMAGAFRVAKALPGEAGTALLSDASEAFMDASRVVMLVCAGVAVLTSVIVRVALKGQPDGKGGPGHGAPGPQGTSAPGRPGAPQP